VIVIFVKGSMSVLLEIFSQSTITAIKLIVIAVVKGALAKQSLDSLKKDKRHSFRINRQVLSITYTPTYATV